MEIVAPKYLCVNYIHSNVITYCASNFLNKCVVWIFTLCYFAHTVCLVSFIYTGSVGLPSTTEINCIV